MRQKHLGPKYVEVEIDVREIIDNISDSELIDIVKERHLPLTLDSISIVTREYLQLAYEALAAGRRGEALALLDRALFPTIPQKSDMPENLAKML